MAGKCDASFRNPDILRILGQSVFCDKSGVPYCCSFVILPVSVRGDPLCPHQDYGAMLPSSLLDMLRGLPSGLSREPPVSKEVFILRTVLVSPCRCIREGTGIY